MRCDRTVTDSKSLRRSGSDHGTFGRVRSLLGFLPAAVLAALVVGCAAAPAPSPAPAVPVPTVSTPPAGADQRFPDIVEAVASRSGDRFAFDVTVSSPYDTPDRYADAFRVRSADGTVFGVRELDHDHATEQPFTRDLADVVIPAGVTGVVVEARDRANGWGGGTRTVELPR